LVIRYWAINSLTVYEYQSDLGINAAPSSLAGASSTVTAASSTVAAASSTIAAATTDAVQPTDAAQTTNTAATTELAAATTAAASSTAPPASSTSGPIFSPLSDYEYIGCIDDIVTRILDGYHIAYDGMTLGSCASDCEDYQYFGLEYGRECKLTYPLLDVR
jgi:hypothetical protein